MGVGMSFRYLVLAIALAPLGGCATGFSAGQAAELCPVVTISKADKGFTGYPGGAPGRSKLDYNHISVITAAAAQCRDNGQGVLVADVTVQYAVEAGTLYRGTAENTVYAATTRNAGEPLRRATSSRTVTPAAGGKAEAYSDIVRDLVVGADDDLEAGDLVIVVGFDKPAP